MLSRHLLRATLLASAGLLALAGAARADAVQDAKDYVAKVTAPVTTWTGPTTGPKAVGHKLIVYVSTDQRNGGARGVGEGVVEAAKVIGWDVRVIDGQGSVNDRAAGIDQAVALKADGLVLGVAGRGRAGLGNRERRQGRLEGGRLAFRPGARADAEISASSPTSPPTRSKWPRRRRATPWRTPNGHAGAVIFTDSAYAIAIAKSDAMAAVIKACTTCKVLSVEDTPLADAANRMPQLTTSLLQRFGAKWTYALSINDLTFDFMAPSLQSAGIGGDGAPHAISAGDGSEPAFQRIRTGDYQVGTVAEPLSLHGWQIGG